MEPTCHRCTDKTWVIFEARPWCRQHFVDDVNQRDQARPPLPAPSVQ
jgi:hypothetical protein